MIRTDEVFKIGYITKHRGLKGEVELSFTDDCFDSGSADYLVLDMDGILVPFFWEEYRFKNNDTAFFKFEHIDNEAQTRTVVGHSVYYPKDHVVVSGDADEEGGASLSSYKALNGYEITDISGKCIGTVAAVDDSSANILLTVEKPDGQEVILPFHNDFLIDYDLKARKLQMDFPAGLLELND